MRRTCHSCGVEAHPGARFCRWCGMRLWESDSQDGDGEVSPQATTVPLSDDVRETDGLTPGDDPRASVDTRRVSRVELERLLRAQPGAGGGGKDAGPTHSSLDATARATDGHAAHDRDHAELDPTLIINSTGEMNDSTGERLPPPPDFDASGDEELTVTVPRRVEPLDAGRLDPERAESHSTSHSTPHAPPPTSDARSATHARSPERRRWPAIVALSLSFLLFMVAASWFIARHLMAGAPNDRATEAPVAPAQPDANQLFEEKLVEAEAMLAQGKLDGAIKALREAAALDPGNTRAHRRLGEILLESGARREAIEEFRAVARNAPEDFTAWRQLAAAEFAEGLYRESAESYRRLIALVGEASADPHDLLSYADALRLSGRTDEARIIYGRLTNVPFAELARVADQRLAQLAPPSEPDPIPSPRAAANGEAAASRGGTEPAQPSSPASAQPSPPGTVAAPTPRRQSPRAVPSSPADHYKRGVELWSSDRETAVAQFREAARGGVADAHYYLGLSYVQGRNLRTLKRAEIVAALQHFQHAERGQHAEQARRYARQLEQEYDRIRR